MNNEETTVENLENLTDEQLEAMAAEGDTEEATTENAQSKPDLEAELERLKNRNATLQRLLNKKDKTITKSNTNTQPDLSKDIAEIKLLRRMDNFAEEHGLTKAQTEKLFSINSNPTADTLKDPFIAEGLKALARKERVDSALPASSRVSSIGGKSFKEMSREEKEANFAKIYNLR